ncbi:MAG: nucleotidyltransferase domain-containing protein [Candidatus Obscuribacterales bacterium]|nr:nucleotidyltransferase domain-containing protein [Candidatus Obscuribacterales bacterium]
MVSRIDIVAKDGEVRRPQGAVGTVVKIPLDGSHSYLIRFLDGSEFPLRRHEISILKQLQTDGWGEPRAFDHLHDFVIYKCVVGSRAYGLETEISDTDRRGIYLPPANLHWSLFGVPEQLDTPETDECYWEMQKFLVLALKSNPNVLECLYSPLVEYQTALAQRLISMRQMFLSQLAYQTYNGYVLSQFKKLEQDLRARGEIKWKHAMHLIRLLLSGITILADGFVPVRVDEHRDDLLAIRNGLMTWDQVNTWRLELHMRFDEAYKNTLLPERPDYEAVNEFLIEARREMTGDR